MPKKIRTGRVYKKTYRDRAGKTQRTSTWYLKYYVNGSAVESSSGTEDYDEAVRMLKKCVAAAVDRPHSKHIEHVVLDQLLDLLIEDYRYSERKTTYDTELRVNAHLRPYFGQMKAHTLGTNAIRQYVAHRRRQQAQPSTINKEQSWLRRAIRLGCQHEPPLALRVPHFKMLPMDNVREGVLEYEKYRLVRDSLPGYARIALVIAFHTGARKGEIAAIRMDRIDMKAERITLPGKTTKNSTPRYLPIYGDMKAELDMAIAAGSANCPFLIQRGGERVHNWNKAWATACAAAGIPEALFHDLRRTAVTNMIEAGLTEKEAMEISGHKTRAVFDRYHIVSDRRMKQNAQKLADHLKAAGQDNGARQKGVIN